MGYTERMNELMDQLNKSIDSVNKLDYFKREILKILDKKEEKEESLSKSIQTYFDDINKTLYGISIEKGRVGTVGEIRTWKDGKKYKKMPDGKWVRVYQHQNRSAEISIARLKGKVRNAQSVDELMNIVMNNIHRFEDENGNVLPIVEELKKEVAAGKSRINSGKPSTQQQIEKFKADKEEKEKQLKTKEEDKKKRAATKKNKNEKIMIKDIPEVFKKGGWHKEFKALADYINGCENANPKAVSLFKNIDKIKFNEPFEVKKLSKNSRGAAGSFSLKIDSDGVPYSSKLELQKGGFEESKKGFLMPIMMHEMGHLFDFAVRPNVTSHKGLSQYDEEFHDAIDNCKLSVDEINTIKDEMIEKTAKFKSAVSKCNSIARETKELNKEVDNYINEGRYSEYDEKYNKLRNEFNGFMKQADEAHGDYMGNELFVDIVDALSDGQLFDNGVGGHGRGYYRDSQFQTSVQIKGKEIFANYISLSICDIKQIDRLRKMFPQVVEKLDILLDRALYNLGVE